MARGGYKGPPPPKPTITSPVAGSTDTTTATPTISGGGVAGDTVTVSIDGTVAGTAPVAADGTWSFTPTAALTNASHTITATQAAAGGPASSASSPDTFTVNVGGGGRTISSAVTGPLSLTTTDTPLTITSAGSVNATASGADAIDGSATTTWTISNAGSITSAGGYGISLSGAGTVSNSGSISGVDGVVVHGGGSVTNLTGGLISGFGALGSGSGSGSGVYVTGGPETVSNSGTISGNAYGVSLGRGGMVTNNATINGGEDGVIVQGGLGTVVNMGAITATVDDNISLFSGGSVTNAAGATLSTLDSNGASIFITGGAGTVSNSGTLSGGNHGIFFTAGGNITNTASASISSATGVFASNVAVTLTNSGSISATGAGAASIDIEAGGNVTNNAGGSISGTSYGVFVIGGGTVTNAGAISGGSYAVDFANSPTNLLVIQPGATFTGGVNGGGGALELAAGTGAGAVSGIGSGVFNHFQTLSIDSGATWTLNGPNAAPTVADNGTLTIAGSLAVSTAIDPSSTGVFQINNNARLEVAADTGTQTKISFLTASALAIDNTASFGTNVGTSTYAGPQLKNFVSGDTIDLKNFGFAGATLNFNPTAGLLQLSNSANQAASLSFETSSLGPGAFHLASDGTSGVMITHA